MVQVLAQIIGKECGGMVLWLRHALLHCTSLGMLAHGQLSLETMPLHASYARCHAVLHDLEHISLYPSICLLTYNVGAIDFIWDPCWAPNQTNSRYPDQRYLS